MSNETSGKEMPVRMASIPTHKSGIHVLFVENQLRVYKGAATEYVRADRYDELRRLAAAVLRIVDRNQVDINALRAHLKETENG